MQLFLLKRDHRHFRLIHLVSRCWYGKLNKCWTHMELSHSNRGKLVLRGELPQDRSDNRKVEHQFEPEKLQILFFHYFEPEKVSYILHNQHQFEPKKVQIHLHYIHQFEPLKVTNTITYFSSVSAWKALSTFIRIFLLLGLNKIQIHFSQSTLIWV